MDSGCIDHIVNDASYFYSYVDLKKPINVKVGNNEYVLATKMGKIMCNFYGKRANVSNVFFVQGMGKNLLSVSALTNKGNEVIFKMDYAKVFNANNKLVFYSKKVNK